MAVTGRLFWACVALILYTYGGYPIVVGTLARLRRRSSVDHPVDWPMVTLVIAAFNEEEVINDKLKNAVATDYPADRLEILVAEDGSEDATADIVRRWEPFGVVLISQAKRAGKSAAINSALQRANGEIVVFSDANAFYEPQALPRLVSRFANPSVGAVTGRKCQADGPAGLTVGEGLYGRYESFIRGQEDRLGSCTSVNGEILAVRRELFEPLPPTIINDDFWIAMRVTRRGFKIAFEPEARSWETTSATSADEVVRRTRMVAGRYQAMMHSPTLLTWRRPLIAWQVISHKFLRPLVPFAAAGAMVTAALATMYPKRDQRRKVVSLAPPWNWVALLGQIAFYVLGATGERFENASGPLRLLSVPRFLITSNRAAVRGLAAYLRGDGAHWQRVRRAAVANGNQPGAGSDSTASSSGRGPA